MAHVIAYKEKIYPDKMAGGGGGSGGGSVELFNLTCVGLNGYTVTLTHTDGTVITQSITESPQTIGFEIPKAGTWTVSNTKNSETLTHIVNTTSDTYGHSPLTQPLTVDVASSTVTQTVNCSAGYYVVLIGTTGYGSKASFNSSSISVTDGSLTYDNKVFASSNPSSDNWCSEIRVAIVNANANTVINTVVGNVDRGRVMILHTSELVMPDNIVVEGTNKDSQYSTSFTMSNGDTASVFCLGTAGHTKSITGNDFTSVSKYDNDNMSYDYLTASNDTTVSVAYTGGTSYGSSGVVVLK